MLHRDYHEPRRYELASSKLYLGTKQMTYNKSMKDVPILSSLLQQGSDYN